MTEAGVQGVNTRRSERSTGMVQHKAWIKECDVARALGVECISICGRSWGWPRSADDEGPSAPREGRPCKLCIAVLERCPD